MPQSTNQILKYTVTTIPVGIFVYFIFRFHKDFYLISDISTSQFIQLLFLSLLTITLNGSKLNQIIKSFGIDIRMKEWFGLSSITLTLNSVLFKAGSLVTSNYLKRKHGFHYMSYVGALGADQLIALLISTLVGLCASVYLAVQMGRDLDLLIGGLVLVCAALIFLLNWKFTFTGKKENFFKALNRAVEALKNIVRDRRLFIIICAHALGMILLTAIRFYIVCRVLHYDISLIQCFLFTTVMIFVRAFPLIQSDLGTRELALGLLAEFLGTGLQSGMMAAFVDRLAVLFWCLITAALFRNTLIDREDSLKT